ncbi:MAG: RHS repeat-associated core domain-containing protein [Acidobacteriota bacterium]
MEHWTRVRYYPSGYAGYIFQSIVNPKYSEHAAAGWRSSLDLPRIEWPKSGDNYDYKGRASFSWNYRIPKVVIHMPDGSSHELRESDTHYSSGPLDVSGTFYAVDGSRLRYDSTDADTGTLFMPDGTRYLIDGNSGQIIDRHGNTLSYDGSDWTDTLGRTIPNPLATVPTTEDDLTYDFPGLSGVNEGVQSYTFKWRELEDSLTPTPSGTPSLKTLASDYLPNPSAAPTDSDQTNYPQQQGSSYQSLFHTAEVSYESGEEPTVVVPTLVVEQGVGEGHLFNPIVLSEIVLPDGTSYKFGYNVYGEVDKVTYPTGAFDQYAYLSTITVAEGFREPYSQTDRNITSRKQSIDGSGNDIQEWKYFESQGWSQIGLLQIVAPDKTRTEIYKILPWTPSDPDVTFAPFGMSDSRAGSVVEKRFYSTSTTGLAGNLLRRELTEYEHSSHGVTYTASGITPTYTKTYYGYRNPRIKKSVSILFEGSGDALAQTTEYEYDTTNESTTGVDQTKVKKYEFAVVSNSSSCPTPQYETVCAQEGSIAQMPIGSLLKTVETAYSTNSTYRTANILGLPTVVKIKDSSGTIVSQSEMSYDDSGFVPSGSSNAMPTTMRTWDSTKGAVTNPASYLETHATFDEYGNRTIATDAKGYETATTYDSTYHAYPVSVTSPIPDSSGIYGSDSAFTTSTTYDVVTGLVLSITDSNGQTSTMEYDDPLLRPKKVTAPNGHETITEYGAGTDDESRWVKVKSQIDEYHWSEAISRYDGLGRAFETEKIDANGNIFAKTEYDVMGRVKRSSNPFKSGETELWTTPEYDDLSRTMKVTSPDTNDVQISYGLSTSGIIGTTKTITDQAGNKRKGITDAAGNMVRVIEDPDGQNLATDYVFDTLGNLRKTTQGEQVRFFSYDSLGRVLRAKQVEQDVNSALVLASSDPVTENNSWTVGYSYDDNGNILTTTDAKNQTITATYDRLNRLTFRDYSDTSTADVSFYYDGTGLPSVPGFSKGKTTKVASTVSETRYTSFDRMGRLLTSEQRTTAEQIAGTQDPYAFAYEYNLFGALIQETYPSGRIVKNTLNADGELSQVQSKKNANHGFFTYADSFAYNAAGAVTKMQLGNGLWETASYDNERLQVKQIGLGVTDSTQNLLKLEFDYEGANPSSSVADRNNGSMREQKITVPSVGSNPGFTATQTYGYDSLNRIESATENLTPIGGTSTQTWKQTFSIDRFGNRNFDTTNSGDTTTLGSCAAAICNPEINTSDNRLKENQVGGSSVDYDYDANGALVKDFNGQRFVYDAESHQKEFFSASNSSSTPDAVYEYDGEGKRIKKIVGTEVTIFVYDAGGQLAAEYSTTIEPPSTAQVSYLTTDHLGSPRIVTDKNGGVISRKDFTAFGEEVISSERVGGSSGNGYNPPAVRQDYTGYQKDDECGLEYAQARYYNSGHGRFTSVDPLTASATIKNPQTFNRYSYVTNSPYKFTDPLGLMQADASQGWGDVSNGFWGSDLNNNSHSGGRGIINAAMVLYDRATYDLQQANRANSLAKKGRIAEAQAIIDANENLEKIEAREVRTEVTVTVIDDNEATEVIIWDRLGVLEVTIYNIRSAAGHVSYVINGQSASWEGETTPDGKQGRYTKHDNPEDYTNERRKISAGTGYVLDFGSAAINAKFKNALLTAYYGSGVYTLTDNNCGHAFQRAINAIAGDLGIPTTKSIDPQAHRNYITKNLGQYLVNKNYYPKK